MFNFRIPSWRDEALCQEFPEEWWIDSKNGATTDKAKAVCKTCDVQKECLLFALEMEQDSAPMHGTYGGLTAKERKTYQLCRYRECGKLIDGQPPNAVYCSDEHERLARNSKYYTASQPTDYHMKGTIRGYRSEATFSKD
jgi:hypothetical protein